MNAYAQNASAGGGGGDGYASLSGSLLARKGEALPAVDAVAHEGVDIEMRPMQPANSPGGPKNISEETIETLRTTETTAPETSVEAPADRRRTSAPCNQGSVRLVHPAPSQGGYNKPSPDAWTIMSPGRSHDAVADRPRLAPPAQARPRPQSRQSANARTRGAICKLRMPAPDLVRLRFASRDLEMSCQAILLEALECYLDANDIVPTSDETIQQETERLLSRAKRKG